MNFFDPKPQCFYKINIRWHPHYKYKSLESSSIVHIQSKAIKLIVDGDDPLHTHKMMMPNTWLHNPYMTSYMSDITGSFSRIPTHLCTPHCRFYLRCSIFLGFLFMCAQSCVSFFLILSIHLCSSWIDGLPCSCITLSPLFIWLCVTLYKKWHEVMWYDTWASVLALIYAKHWTCEYVAHVGMNLGSSFLPVKRPRVTFFSSLLSFLPVIQH